ncbi:hypothetical protein ACFVAF_38445 [Streptomyces sp. NPDC057596]|uniref:hypothetical protein n=1 Tax=Streptomyces sp. NPDC057596 TaxID=3346178 RepID=UPI00369101B9
MSGDTGSGRVSRKRPRVLERARVGWPRALRELKDLLYEVYLAAGAPSLDEITADIAADDTLAGAPERDTVRRCISDPSPPPKQADAVSVATVLARRAAWDVQDLAGRVRDLWVQARMAQGVGRPISEFSDNLVLADLEVHPALDTGGAHHRFGALPAYVPREHDTHLEKVVAAAAVAGRSGITVLVGGSSTGKTRALWEAVRKLPAPWRLWHPISPSRPDAALADLADIAPHTVVWLNEAQRYLDPDPLGERVAAGLRSLLNDPSRAPVLVLATLWPDHWQTLATPSKPDRHAHAWQLLHGHEIDVPDAFTHADLASLAGTAGADPRLVEAAERAHDAQVTQYLAGVPVLTARYDTARGATRALIHAAMDARRLGAGPHIPLAWLADAAPGYLTNTEWNTTSDDWLSHALDYVTQECNGIPGILTPVKTTTRNQRNRRPTATNGTAFAQSVQDSQGPHYLLADFLDQHGRHHRAGQIPPIDFWTAAAHHAHPTDWNSLGDAAWNRGLYRDAAQLHKHAAAYGNPYAPNSLVRHFQVLHPTDRRPAQWAAAHMPLDDPYLVALLLNGLRRAGAEEQVDALLARDPAAHVALDVPFAVAGLLDSLRKAGAQEQADALAARAPRVADVVLDDLLAAVGLLDSPRRARVQEGVDALLADDAAAQAALDDPYLVAEFLISLREAGAQEQVNTLAARAAAHVAVSDPSAVAGLLSTLRSVEAQEQVDALLVRDPAAHVALDDPFAVAGLLICLRDAGAQEQVDALAARAAAHKPFNNLDSVASLLEFLWTGAQEQVNALPARDLVADTPLDNPSAVAELLDSLGKAEAQEQVDALLARDPAAHVALSDPSAVAGLLDSLRRAEAQEQVDALLARDPAAHVALDNPYFVAGLLDSLRRAGAQEQVDALLARDPAAHVALDNLYFVAGLLDSLRRAGAQEQVDALAARAAAHKPLDNPRTVAELLDSLRRAGAQEQVDALLARDPAAHVALDNPSAVAELLDSLRKAEAQEQVAALAARFPAAGYFDQFIKVGDNLEQLRLGREPDGSAAPSWTWDDLE